MRFLQLAEREVDGPARLLSAEHSKTIADAHGDIQRSSETVEFAAGTSHFLGGEFTGNAGHAPTSMSIPCVPRPNFRTAAILNFPGRAG